MYIKLAVPVFYQWSLYTVQVHIWFLYSTQCTGKKGIMYRLIVPVLYQVSLYSIHRTGKKGIMYRLAVPVFHQGSLYTVQ